MRWKGIGGNMGERKLLSIVVPAYNERDNVALLYDQIAAAMATVSFRGRSSEGTVGVDLDCELIFVDDGSEDGTADVVRELYRKDPRVKGIALSRNFGHEIASTAGLDAARGDAAVLMDADLQDPPAVIPALIEKWREAFDVVSAQRVSRKGESLFKRASAFLFYRVMGLLVGWHLPADAGDFRLMSRAALDAFLRCRERNRFVRALAAWTGFRQTTVPFERAKRRAGRTKYGFTRLFSLAATGLTSFSTAPLCLATWIGLMVLAVCLCAVVAAAAAKLSGACLPEHAFLVLSIWFLGGVQCLLIGILGEYVGRAYTESQRRPLYFVREFIGDLPVSREKERVKMP